jgi:iron-sulfur cluster assembly accessory protein
MKVAKDAAEFLIKFLREKAGDSNYVCRNGVRLTTKRHGCSGTSYVLSDVTINEILTQDYICLTDNGISVWFSRDEKEQLKDCSITLEKKQLNSEIVIQNPSQDVVLCGCGKSFQEV